MRKLYSFVAMGSLLLVLAFLIPAHASGWQKKPASEFQLPTPERVGAFLHPVIFASSEVQVEPLRRSLANVKQKLVVRWGVHVFEVGEAVYSCKSATDCEFEDFIRVATYEFCEVKNQTVTCTGLLAGNGGAIENNSPNIHDTFDVEPTRGGGEFDEPTLSEESIR